MEAQKSRGDDERNSCLALSYTRTCASADEKEEGR